MQGYRIVFHPTPYHDLASSAIITIASLVICFIGLHFLRYRKTGATIYSGQVRVGSWGLLEGNYDRTQFIQERGYTPISYRYLSPWQTTLYAILFIGIALTTISFLFVELYPI